MTQRRNRLRKRREEETEEEKEEECVGRMELLVTVQSRSPGEKRVLRVSTRKSTGDLNRECCPSINSTVTI